MTATMSFQEAREYLGYPEKLMYEVVKRSDFPSYKEGKYWRIHRRKLDEWLDSKVEEKLDYLY